MNDRTTPSLRDALGVLDDLFFVFDERQRLVEWNPAVTEVTGYSTDELREMGPSEFFDDGDAERVREAVEEMLATGAGQLRAKLVTVDGERIPYEFRVKRLDGEQGGFAGIGRDVTAADRQREKLTAREQALRTMHGIISDRNRSFEEQVEGLLALGSRELDVAYGTLSRIDDDEYHLEIVHADDGRIEAGDVFPLSATNCEVTASTEQTLVAGDIGSDRPELAERAGYTEMGIRCYLGAPVYADDEVYGTFCFYDTDSRSEGFGDWQITLVDLMSRWVSAELQRRKTMERLQRQNERLEQFTSLVSHDLRNPLNVVQGSLELAEETGDEQYFEQCRRAVERIDALVDDLLVLARTGEDLDELEPVGLRQFAETCWTTVSTERATLDAGADGTVLADRTRLRQLFENLFRNAVEHGAPDADTGVDATDPASTPVSESTDAPLVTVTVGDLEDGFFVADDGVGIPADERDRIFESGYSTTTDGTGFGLAIVGEVADAHGWDVAVTGSAAGGARFEFTGVERPEPSASGR